MDGSTEDELTRPPEERDLIVLARELNRLGVRYVVIGGLAILERLLAEKKRTGKS